jgi:hypothetical protein
MTDHVRIFTVEQTEQFRIHAASEEEAIAKLLEQGDQHPDVEWMGCTNRTATDVTGDGSSIEADPMAAQRRGL